MNMNTFHVNEPVVHPPREKRLKVSRACYTCRVKKIKCDGIQPCMQCKARKRPCSFSKDGSIEQTNQQPSNTATPSPTVSANESIPNHQKASNIQPQLQQQQLGHKRPRDEVPAQHILTNEHIMKEQEKFRSMFGRLDHLSTVWPGEGKEGRWSVDVHSLFIDCPMPDQPLQATQQQLSNESLDINSSLLNLFFRHHHTLFPILPKSIFYRCLKNRDNNQLINQLLLYSIYCNAAHYSNEDKNEANNYFEKAQQLLSEDYFTHSQPPSVTCIIALCLLSTFESGRYHSSTHYKNSVYLDMACRMCCDLQLNRRNHHNSFNMTPDDIELRKRVFWACYCLDKVQSLIMTKKPALLSSRDVDIDYPGILGADEANDYDVNASFFEHIKLMQLCEQVLQVRPSYPRQQFLDEEEQAVLHLDNQLLTWLRNLPHMLQWTPAETSLESIPTHPPPNSSVAHLHLIFNCVELALLQPIAYMSMSSTPTAVLIRKRCEKVATNLTQLTCAMSEQPNFILSFQLMAEAIMSAIRVHIVDCANEKLPIARHARFMFQRSFRSLKAILPFRAIDGISEFTSFIEKTLADAETNVSQSRYDNARIHVLSPIIPKPSPTTFSPQQIQHPHHHQQQHPHPQHQHHPSTSSFNSHHMVPFGLASPALSTTSTPAAVSTTAIQQHSIFASAPTSTTSSPYIDYNNNPLSNQRNANAMNSQQQQQQQQTAASVKNTNVDAGNLNHTTMDIYSTVWSKAPLGNDFEQKLQADTLANASFMRQTEQQQQQPPEQTNNNSTNQDTNASATAANNLYTMWQHQQDQQQQTQRQPEDTALNANSANNSNPTAATTATNGTTATSSAVEDAINPFLFTLQQQRRYGLGVYASAQQHHTDVISQHMPGVKAAAMNRAVLLNHFGQVIVAGSDGADTTPDTNNNNYAAANNLNASNTNTADDTPNTMSNTEQ